MGFWRGTPPVIRTNNAPFTHTFASAGNYLVKLIVTTAGWFETAREGKMGQWETSAIAKFPFHRYGLPAEMH